MAFLLFISLLILQRIIELVISKRNERWLLKNGAVEYGHGHYHVIVYLHVLFIASLMGEYIIKNPVTVNYILLGTYIVLLVLKVWVIASLGKFWNTKVFRVWGMNPIKKGPYK